MFEHRLCTSWGEVLFFDASEDASEKFSNFDFIRDNLKIACNIPALHRCFSLARDAQMSTVVLENIKPEGIIREEEEVLRKAYPEYKCEGLFRISFWKEKIDSLAQWETIPAVSPLGYLILKKDFVPGEKEAKTIHIFEAMFADSVFCPPGSHRFNHCAAAYRVKLIDRVFEIRGVLFAQQNGLSKCCAHVALYSIVSMHNKRNMEPSFALMNTIIGKTAPAAARGLTLADIKKILNAYGIQYTIYPRKKYPFHRIVYSGVESGGGVLLAFGTTKYGNVKRFLSRIPFIGRFFVPKSPGHIIPCWGHVFERDIWTPMASRHYFKDSRFHKTRYYASDNWTSHFIAHDDNFGCDMLIPRDYFHPEQIFYCIEIHDQAFGKHTAIEAEVQALAAFEDIFTSLGSKTEAESREPDRSGTKDRVSFDSGWLERLRKNIGVGSLILRTFSASKREYFEHLRKENDWDGNREPEETVNDLEARIDCSHIWITEISVPQLFSSNERKLCDVIGNPENICKEPREYALLVRMPGFYVLKQKDKHIFFESKLISHIRNLSVHDHH